MHRVPFRHALCTAWVLCALFAGATRALAAKAKLPPQPVDATTPVDHDGQPIPMPKVREENLREHQLREAVVQPMSHTLDLPDRILELVGHSPQEPAANVDAYDEVPNSTWFTNRNHVRAVPPEAVRLGGADSLITPAPPYTIKARKSAGVNAGFTIKDAAGRRWIVKLDKPGYPQLGSGADVVVARLFWAAGYNVSHDVVFAFTRDQLKIDADLAKGDKKTLPFGEADLDSLLLRGDRGPDGRYFGQASLYLEGKPVGPIQMRSKRPDDPNDLYGHKNRRELRGLYVLCSWVGSWDTKDQQSLDTFLETGDSLGYVRHHLLDFGASLGAAAEGPRPPTRGYEYTVDGKWTALRFLTLGFVHEPWRDIPQEAPIPALGNFESTVYQPDEFKTLQPHASFRERVDADDYWGAKLVASFSNAQIAAAIDAAGYEDPRVKPALLALLIERRDKLVRHYFARIAPLDFFVVAGGELRFHDLATDRGLSPRRSYTVEIHGDGANRRIALGSTALALSALGADARQVDLRFRLAGSDAERVSVTLLREGTAWTIARIRHA
jgi:hypothetical protein